jgi:tRNA A37 threonylcarbamoyltransferase TsaD
MSEERGAKFFCPERSLLVDNAAMIGYLGIKMFNAGIFVKPEDLEKLDINPRERTDQVEVVWR